MNLTEERKKQSKYKKWLRAKKRLKKKNLLAATYGMWEP